MAHWQRQALGLLGLLGAYMAAELIFSRCATVAGWTILWPLNGISIALLLRAPRKRWPMLLLAIQGGLLAAQMWDRQPFGAELLKRVWSATEIGLSAWMLPAFVSMEDWLAQPRIVRRASMSLVLPPTLTALGYAVQLHLQLGAPYFQGWNYWGPPDILGNAVMLPVALAFASPEGRQLLSPERRNRTLLVLGASALVSVLIFSEGSYPLLFLLYPMLLCVDSQLSFAGSSGAILLASIVGLFCTMRGCGPFGEWSPALHLPSGTALQVYLGFHALALLPLSLVILERRNIAGKLERANAQLVALAQQDALTGIANRRAFDHHFTEAWSRAIDTRLPLSLLMIDIDQFKQYNDLYGHLAGDCCLARVAAVLTCVARGPGTLVARFGGEEFAVLLPNHTPAACYRAAEDLRQAVVTAGLAHEASPWSQVTISIGCATAEPRLNGERLELLASADAALYRAKEQGRNRWECAGDGFQDANTLLYSLFHA